MARHWQGGKHPCQRIWVGWGVKRRKIGQPRGRDACGQARNESVGVVHRKGDVVESGFRVAEDYFGRWRSSTTKVSVDVTKV